MRVTERLLAIQGQDPRGARLAIRARSRGATATDVDRALGSRRVADHVAVPRHAAPGHGRRLSAAAGADDAATGDRVGPPTCAGGSEPIGGSARARDDRAGARRRRAARHRLAAGAGARRRGRGRRPGDDSPAVPRLARGTDRARTGRRAPSIATRSSPIGCRRRLPQSRGSRPIATVRWRAGLRYLAGHGPADARDLAQVGGLPLRDAAAGLAAIGGRTARAGRGLVELGDAAGRPAARTTAAGSV